MHQQFEGIWVPIVTPFSGGQINHSALARLAQHLVSKGVKGLVLAATTGEGAFLSLEERLQMTDSLRSALPEGFPLVIGLNGMDTAGTAAQAKALKVANPAGLLVTAPPYVRPAQDGLKRHFEAIVEAADLPLIIYDIPYRTGVEITIETLQELAADPRIVGIKSCGASVDRLMRLVHETPLRVLIGEDTQFFAALALGAHGAIAASAHYRPELWVRIHELVQKQELNAARELAVPLQAMIRALFAEPNPAPIKAWLANIGMLDNELRLPFVPASAKTLARILSIANRLNEL